MAARVATNLQTPVGSDERSVVDLYRQGKLTQFELSLSLGISRLEVDGILKKYGVTEDLPDAEEYELALSHLHQKTPE